MVYMYKEKEREEKNGRERPRKKERERYKYIVLYAYIYVSVYIGDELTQSSQPSRQNEEKKEVEMKERRRENIVLGKLLHVV